MSKSEEKNIEKIIYHYCSVEIFISIIENQELWASDIFKMNDSFVCHRNPEAPRRGRSRGAAAYSSSAPARPPESSTTSNYH